MTRFWFILGELVHFWGVGLVMGRWLMFGALVHFGGVGALVHSGGGGVGSLVGSWFTLRALVHFGGVGFNFWALVIFWGVGSFWGRCFILGALVHFWLPSAVGSRLPSEAPSGR